MLLLHQVGSVKIGEVVRYTVTYNPSRDRILPSPEHLHLRIRNTSPIPLRAAFVHGPYTLHVSAYPSHYDPNTKFENPRRYGIPEFEPMLKAGGSWTCKLTVPDNIRQSAGAGAAAGNFNNATSSSSGGGGGGGGGGGLLRTDGSNTEEPTTASWIIEVASQVMFSSSAAVGYEVLLARDEKSFNISSLPAMGNSSQVPQPGRVSDFQQSIGAKDGHHPAQLAGVYSKAITLVVEDTASLWNTPRLPDHSHHEAHHIPKTLPTLSAAVSEEAAKPKRRKKIHLVVLTHGLHSNLGADMLYLKESIDAAARQAKKDRKVRKAKDSREDPALADAPDADGAKEQNAEKGDDDDEDEDEEEVIVRGFSGNATRTERGIKFLGKRLARYVLSMTYPDQPYLPSIKNVADGIPTAVKQDVPKSKDEEEKPVHNHSTIHKHRHLEDHARAYQITSISFVGHSLGGLVQMYAIAYIQKHSPEFFSLIKPVNFIALASPLLGLSNENPIYVKFALDFGLVGRSGRDLGLTWRAPTLARSGWGALMGSLGEAAHKKGDAQPESKPLLRILPTGPAHTALKQFRNRTVYSNVVNDGIVPLRTGCLLFLDWQGLGRVEKARREAGLVGTVMGFGWAELTGANVSARRGPWSADSEVERPMPPSPSDQDRSSQDEFREVPQPSSDAVFEDDRQSLHLATSYKGGTPGVDSTAQTNNDSPFAGFFNLFKASETANKVQKPPPNVPRDNNRIYRRSQTLKVDESRDGSTSPARSIVTSGNELEEEHENGPPPRTTILEAAGDLLNPVMPTNDFLLDPSKRPRTIFHDRIYHPSDIPPPPMKRRSTGLSFRRKSHASVTSQSSAGSPPRRGTGDSIPSTNSETPVPGIKQSDSSLSAGDYTDPKNHPKQAADEVIDTSSMKVEEKIARAYHRDLSWRKVLVKMEPDAHNNIIVRRMFSNAHGWPVVKHLCDTHFSDSAAARTADEVESNVDHAKAPNKQPSSTGAESSAQPQGKKTYNLDGATKEDSDQFSKGSLTRSNTETLEADDNVPDLPTQSQERGSASHSVHNHNHPGSPPGSSSSSISSGPSSRPPAVKRIDSATWSDRDFADSGDDDDSWDTDLAYGAENSAARVLQRASQVDEGGAAGRALQRPPEARLASARRGGGAASHDGGGGDSSNTGGWNWTEKIAGKGTVQKKKGGGGPTSPISPTTPTAGSGSFAPSS
ncbi:putative serine esterase-domain-containing protein [Microdochium bolleyi]|uniref:Putative serine esterase-domain-containing protein n=1 Tax=Microdochium bolleyi TaxID=196109 RepID=A0A136JEM9_9PEZI|nr:putative serine esterase-domain-containing protein [Microdochium bolleyi]